MKLIGGVNDMEDLSRFLQNRRSQRNFRKFSKRNNNYRNSRAKSERFRKSSRAKTERVRQKERERYSYQTRRVKSNTHRKKKSLNKTRHIPEERKKIKPKKELQTSRRNVIYFKNLLDVATRKLIKPRAHIEVPPREF